MQNLKLLSIILLQYYCCTYTQNCRDDFFYIVVFLFEGGIFVYWGERRDFTLLPFDIIDNTAARASFTLVAVSEALVDFCGLF